MKRKGVFIAALALILVLAWGSTAMAAAGTLTQIEHKWLDVQRLVLQEMVKEGRITQEQADEQFAQMKEHLRASEGDNVYGCVSRRIEIKVGFMGLMADAWAELTGQDPQDIIKTCREKKTSVWQLAQEAGRVDELKQKIVSLSEAKLDAMVAEGRMTAEQKAKILDVLKKSLDNEDFPFGHGPKGCPRKEH